MAVRTGLGEFYFLSLSEKVRRMGTLWFDSCAWMMTKSASCGSVRYLASASAFPHIIPMADLPRSNPDASAEPADGLTVEGSGTYSVALPESAERGDSSAEMDLEAIANPALKAAATGEVTTDSGQSAPEHSVLKGGETPVASRPPRGCGPRSLQWLSLLITLPFLGLNGLAAWQAHSLTHYSKANADSRPTFAQPPLKRLGAFVFGVKVPRPENSYSPTEIGLAFDSHRIDLGNGEFLDGWYVPAPKATPEVPAESKPEADPVKADASEGNGEIQADAPNREAQVPQVTEPVENEGEAVGLQVVPEPIQASEKQGVVLLFPAYAASKQTLLQEIKLLHRIGYATFAVDLRGVGDSSGSDTTLGRREAEDVAATVDYVTKTFDNPPIALYGRILGAGHVMRAIAEFNLQPDALILEDPYAQLFSLTQAVVESVGLPRSPTTQMLTLWGGLLQEGDPAALDPINYAGEITTPTLVLYGSDASWVSLDEIVGVHSQLQGPKEIVGLRSERDVPVSATAVGPWMGKVETFLDSNMGQ